MTRLRALDPDEATGKSKELFDGINRKLGMVPNMMRTMGNSSAVLEGYLNLNDSLSKGTLGARISELIAITVAETNSCSYCLSAHSYIGENLIKIEGSAIAEARKGQSDDQKTQSALQFAKTLVNKRGLVDAEDVEAVKSAGYSDGEVAEIVAHVGLNTLTNYLNNTAATDIDFPEVVAH